MFFVGKGHLWVYTMCTPWCCCKHFWSQFSIQVIWRHFKLCFRFAVQRFEPQTFPFFLTINPIHPLDFAHVDLLNFWNWHVIFHAESLQFPRAPSLRMFGRLAFPKRQINSTCHCASTASFIILLRNYFSRMPLEHLHGLSFSNKWSNKNPAEIPKNQP